MIRRTLLFAVLLAGCEADHMTAPRPHQMEDAAAFVLAAGSSSDRAALVALLDRVTGLSLSRNNLTGPIPPELDNLERLRYLNPCFAWGYGGGGPAQLALAILMDRTGAADRAARHYQAFKRDMVVRWPWTASGSLAVAWTRPVSAVDAWLEGRT